MTFRHMIPFIVLAILTVATASADLRDEFPFYVGDEECRKCHVLPGEQKSCSYEDPDQHALAYEVLKNPQSLEIAALNGVAEEPWKSRICMGCHSTGSDVGARWWEPDFKPERGVQCEACHGPGGHHIKAHESAALNALAGQGLYIHRGDESDCKECHVDLPSHVEVLERGFARAPEDPLYKTPINLQLSPDGARLYVVCYNTNSLIALDTASREVVGEVTLGKRSQDIAQSPDGGTIFVTNRLDDTVSVIDARRFEVLRTVPTGDDPHGVRTSPDGKRLFVLNSGQDSVSVIDCDDWQETKRLVTGDGPWGLAMSPDREVFLATNVRPQPAAFRASVYSEITEISARRGVVTRRLRVPDTNSLKGIAYLPGTRIALFTALKTKHLIPGTRLAQGWSICNAIGVVWPDGRTDHALLDAPNDHFPDPAGIAITPDGRHALVTSGGSNLLGVVDVEALLRLFRSSTDEERERVLPNHLGKSAQFLIKRIPVGVNPRAVVVAPGGELAYVANALDDTLSVIDLTSLSVVDTITLGGPEESSEIRLGERLFHSAHNAFANQFSCASCHPDGHINGLTFDIEPDGAGMSPVDNRTLRGIFDTPPFKWEGLNPSLSRQCGPRLAVFFTRLDPYTPEELQALVRYMSVIECPPNRYRDARGLTLSQRRGKAVFERTSTNRGTPLPAFQQCTTCHNTPFFTSRELTNVGTTMWFDAPASDFDVANIFGVESFGLYGTLHYIDMPGLYREFDVPHLNQITESPPYLHNGTALTLEEIWTRFNIYERHGMSGDMTRRQYNDLIAYLRTL